MTPHSIAMWIEEVKNIKCLAGYLTIVRAQWIFTQWRIKDVVWQT